MGKVIFFVILLDNQKFSMYSVWVLKICFIFYIIYFIWLCELFDKCGFNKGLIYELYNVYDFSEIYLIYFFIVQKYD